VSVNALRTLLEPLLDAGVDACLACVPAAEACAEECLAAGGDGPITRAFLADLDCADLCRATARSLQRFNGTSLPVTRAILEACRAAASECAAQGEASERRLDGACRSCITLCRRVQRACGSLLDALVER
jgi:hypothetical protein